MSISQKIGIWLYRNIDKGFIYQILKDLHKNIRYIFYIFLPTSSFLIMNFLANTIDITKYEEKNIIFALFVVFCIKITIAGVTSILSLFWTYESLFNINIEQKIKEQKEKKRFIKKNKLQWWRLRNMHILVRFLIYLLVSYITIIYIKIIAFASFIENSTGINLFANNFELLMKYTTVSLILIVLVVEFLVRKNIKKRLVK